MVGTPRDSGTMISISFTPNLQRHVDTRQQAVNPAVLSTATLQELLSVLFEREPRLRNYIVDDQNKLRKHVNIFVDGVYERELTKTIGGNAEVFIMQALSGG